ncbi:MAG TPA: hypothetical protein VN829_16525 [Dongiaceae bacterium]|nr:hypothetical protein [Dongiaceae bacterium]
MSLIDLILNLAGLLFWLNWRSMRFDPLAHSSAATLAGTLKRAEPQRLRGWQFLAGLGGLLLFRALLYWQIGGAAGWTPKLDLTWVVLAFRCDHLTFRADVLGSALLYSVLSFVRLLAMVYFWLLALVAINRKGGETDPLQKLLRAHLGGVGRWPWWVQSLLPLVLAAGLWAALHPLLVSLNVTGPVQSPTHLLEQGLLLGAALYLSLKYLLPGLLLLHLVVSYVYLGRNPLWDFVSLTSHNLLAPLRRLPLRYATVDFAPLAGAALILLLLHVLPVHALPWLEQRYHLKLWPVWPV